MSKEIAVKSVGKMEAWPVQRWHWPPRWACQGWCWELKQQFHVFRRRRLQSRQVGRKRCKAVVRLWSKWHWQRLRSRRGGGFGLWSRSEEEGAEGSNEEHICSQEGERGGRGKEDDKVAMTTKEADVCLLPVAQLWGQRKDQGLLQCSSYSHLIVLHHRRITQALVWQRNQRRQARCEQRWTATQMNALRKKPGLPRKSMRKSTR